MSDVVAAPTAPPVPRVSVIVPCYNHVAYVEGAIRSVLAQSYPAVELIVIDDGSSDGSAELIRRLAAHHGFTAIVQENRGICRTLNRAIREAATGEWIGLLASDDLWREDKLARQMAALAEQPDSRFCFSQAIEFDDPSALDRGTPFPAQVRTGHVLNRVFLRQHVPAGTMLFARCLYETLGGFDETLREEDWDFVIRSAAMTPFAAVAAPLLFYRAHPGNTMRTRARGEIFRQKAMLLSKNMHLVSPWRWLASMLFHFAHDIVWAGLRARIAGDGKATGRS